MPSFNRKLVIKIILVRRERLRAQRKARAMSIRPILFNRLLHGESFLVHELLNDPDYHHVLVILTRRGSKPGSGKIFLVQVSTAGWNCDGGRILVGIGWVRMTKNSFDEILHLIEPDITCKKTHSRPIMPIEKPALTLRYMASGNSQVSLALSYRFSPSAVSGILREVTRAICKKLWNHPNACGAVDGKHIRVQAPALSGSTHFNYKNFFSVVLLAIADPNYKFTAVHIGASGSQSDGGIFGRSSLGMALETGTLGLPPPKQVGGKVLPHVLLGDDAFPLRKFMMKPFPGKFLEKEKRIYNYRMSRGRIVVENAFEILAMDHNGITGDIFEGEEIIPGSWRDEIHSYKEFLSKAVIGRRMKQLEFDKVSAIFLMERVQFRGRIQKSKLNFNDINDFN
ncbi:putative nuclease HARBI1 [Folsomia candida]|uniref:Putative nuclease HARBI1 n=1 Tax=Folsomia candida TaxID=158441 RepID=A0A226DHB6_FOLCA|nr:putative nuclease HARBI1 [Folsomia candida]